MLQFIVHTTDYTCVLSSPQKLIGRRVGVIFSLALLKAVYNLKCIYRLCADDLQVYAQSRVEDIFTLLKNQERPGLHKDLVGEDWFVSKFN